MKLTTIVIVLMVINIAPTLCTFKRLKKYYDEIEPIFDFFTKKSSHHKKHKSHHSDEYVHHKEIIKEVPVLIPVGHSYNHGGPHHGFYGALENYGHGGYRGQHGGHFGDHGGYYGEHGGYYGKHIGGLFDHGHGGYGGFISGHAGFEGYDEVHDFH